MKSPLLIVFLILACPAQVYAGEQMHDAHALSLNEGESFAQEYIVLSNMLVNVTSSESAIQYKSRISQEIDRIKTTQINGEQEYKALSAEEKKAFVKKFQNNNQHCGAVTQVMQERTRILLDPNLSKILGSTIKDIP